MSSPTSYTLLSRFSSLRTSKLSECSSSEATPSYRSEPVLRVVCFAPSSKIPIPGSQSVPGGARHEHQHPTTSAPLADEWWRRPPQHRGRGSGSENPELCADLTPSVLRTGQSVSDWILDPKDLKEHTFHETPTSIGTTGGVPVFVMLPLDSVRINNTLNRKRALNASLAALKCAGVEGIMMDVWWGIVEKDVPEQYNWGAYRELIDIATKHGLKVQAVMSFHQCGGNVGDSCVVPLPKWVVDEINKNPDIVYTDKSGNRNYEYLSLGCDQLPVLRGRTPLQAYLDFMRSFRDEFCDLLDETIVEIQVGMGPAGELRYPSYPESNGRWKFPGIGEFQCYDKYMLSSLKAAAERAGHSEWGHGGPHNAGHYKQWPDETEFFHKEGTWNNPYGEFFLNWYSDMLLAHGERLLSAAGGIFRGSGAHLSGKVAGIHWHYGTRSHAPELTAGYYNTRYRDGYYPVARMFARYGVTLNFTCIEMKDAEQPECALCSPEGLLRQVVLAARKAGIRLAGENALPRYDQTAHNQVVGKSRLHVSSQSGENDEPMCSFTYLRMCETLFKAENWQVFVPFVRHMGEGKTFHPWEKEHEDTQLYVNASRPLIQEAASLMYH